MKDTLYRHWQTLQFLPRAPRKIPASRVEELLTERGFSVSRRSVERDLQKLSAFFPIICDDRHKPYGWSFSTDATVMDLPGMDVHTALAFQMASEHLERLLPSPTYGHLQPHFEHARGVLEGLKGAKMRRWPKKIKVVPSTMPIVPTAFDAKILEDIQEAVLHEKQVLVTYCRRGEEHATDYVVNPHGIVYRDAVAYLVCTFWTYDNPMQLKLHRMVETEIMDTPAKRSKTFTFESYLEDGGMGFLVGKKPLKLRLAMDEDAVVSLLESPLAEDQKVSKPKDGRVTLRATVPDSHQTRAYLRSYGATVEVLGPKSLRDEFVSEAKALSKLYR